MRYANAASSQPLPQFPDDWVRKTPYEFGNLTLVIEYLAGDKRTKRNESGFVVTGVMPTAYGCILGTTDAHGEEIDMYLAPMPSIDADIYVIDQVNPQNGVFDEHKVMLGFSSMDEAVFIYESVFGDNSGERRIGEVVTMTKEAFSAWLNDEGSSLKPASEFTYADTYSTTFSGVKYTARTNREAPKPRDEAGGVVIELPSVKDGPKLRTVVDDDRFHHHLYLFSPFETEVWSNTVDTVVRMLDLGNETETMHIHIACPGGSVFLMGRMVSAMKATRVKVITYAEGSVASAATSIWAFGHERHVLPAAYFMQHMSSQLLYDKTTNIAAKAVFGVGYIERQTKHLVDIGLFTEEEVKDMSEKSADIYISGTDALGRVGKVSGDTTINSESQA